MNNLESKYTKYDLCKEMLETSDIIKSFNQNISQKYINKIELTDGLFLTGEGSSRIFPAKHIIYQNKKYSCGYDILTEGSLQSMEYNLDTYSVFGCSNSGKTSELMRLFNLLSNRNHRNLFGLISNFNTPLENIAIESTVLECGTENAVAATKSVVEQALFFHSLYANLLKKKMFGLDELSYLFTKTLETPISQDIINVIANANTIYFAGRNNGVAEEIALKTNEITRKKSGYLEGTYAVHGIEEVLKKQDVIVVFDPFPSEEDKFYTTLVEGAGIEVIAISTHKTKFKTLIIPESRNFQNYLELAMGWNLLVETGIHLGIDLDKPERARKVGNEYIPTV